MTMLLLAGTGAVAILLLMIAAPGVRLGAVLLITLLATSRGGNLAHIAAASCLLLALPSIARVHRMLRSAFVSILAAWILLSVLSLAWSPNSQAVLLAIEGPAEVLCVLAISLEVWNRRSAAGLFRPLLALSPVILFEALTIVIFRIYPGLERQYYGSTAAASLLGDQATYLYTTMPNNATDPLRAAGVFFVNVNRAGMALGMTAAAFLALGLLLHRRAGIVIALILLACIPFTGSKTGLTLLVLIPAASLLFVAVVRARDPGRRLLTGLAGICALGAGAYFALSFAEDYDPDVFSTLTPRRALWANAFEAIGKNPLTGLGYGGWSQAYRQGHIITGYSEMPAHNFFLIDWLNGGLMLVLLDLAFVIAVLIVWSRAVARAPDLRQAIALSFAGGVLAWGFIHGQGDNSVLLGAPWVAGPVGIALALLLEGSRGKPGRGLPAGLDAGERQAPYAVRAGR